LGRLLLGEEEAAPPFVFDAGYDPVKLQQGLEGSPCQIIVRLRSGRCFYADPYLAGPPAPTGRARRHGPKMKCAETRAPGARTFHGVHVRGHRLRSGARKGLGELASEGPGSRRTGQPRASFARGARDALVLVLRWNGCRVARDGESRSSCGCGGTVRRGVHRT
jgi:hypothetical protein